MAKIKISEALVAIRIYPNLKGYKYIIEAVKIFKDSGDSLRITKTIYPEIAKKYNDKNARIERAIRHAINIAEQKNYADSYPWKHSSFYHYTNSEFIALLAQYTEI